MKRKTVKQIVRPRHGNYVDYGAPRRVLMKKGARELHWVGGSTVTIGIGLRDYSPSQLVFRPDGERLDGVTLQTGGRLSRALLAEHDAELRRLFDEPRGRAPLAREWQPGKTLLLDGVDRGADA